MPTIALFDFILVNCKTFRLMKMITNNSKMQKIMSEKLIWALI